MNARRLQYLKAMDIDVWQRRGFAVAATLHESRQASQPTAPVRSAQASSSHAPASAHMPLADNASPTANTMAGSLSSSMTNAMNWDELSACVRDCTVCELHKTRTQTVFGVGNRQADWMVIGEAPGADEDRQGEPFVGRAGQLLNAMLKAIGYPREQVFIANVLKCRPPGNRDPKPEEAVACAGYLARQIELVNPKVILCVGRIAAQNLLNTDTPIGKLRGQVHRLGERPVVVTYHPAYLLRAPAEKRKAWQDLQLALRIFADAMERS